MSFLLSVSWDCVKCCVKSSGFSDCSILSARKCSSLVDVRKLITPKPLIVSGHPDNRWKEGKIIYNSCIGLMVRFPSEQSQSYIFRLLLTVKSVWCQCQKSLLKLSWTIEGWPSPWCFTTMMGCPWYIHEGSFHEMVSIHLPGSTISVSLQQPCVCACLQSLSSNHFIYEWSLDQCLDQVTFMAESFLSEASVTNLIITLRNFLLRWDGFGCRPKTLPRLLSFEILVITALSV
jgi:hypothetical protein